MGGLSLGIAIEALVAVLLAVTIGYCVLVNRKLIQLRSDQSELKVIIRDLHAATGQAEHAIAGLRESAQLADQTLVQQIERVRTLDEQLRTNIGKGESLLAKFAAMPRAPQARRPATSAAEEQSEPIRQNAIGLGMLNAQRRRQDEKSANGPGRDEVAA
jgi:hypothetical protein